MKAKTIWMLAWAACATSAASAQTVSQPRVLPASEACLKMPQPVWPSHEGTATYQVLTVVREGRIASVDILTVKSRGVSRKDERAVKNAIVQTVQLYQCKADGLYSIEQTLELPAVASPG